MSRFNQEHPVLHSAILLVSHTPLPYPHYWRCNQSAYWYVQHYKKTVPACTVYVFLIQKSESSAGMTCNHITLERILVSEQKTVRQSTRNSFPCSSNPFRLVRPIHWFLYLLLLFTGIPLMEKSPSLRGLQVLFSLFLEYLSIFKRLHFVTLFVYIASYNRSYAYNFDMLTFWDTFAHLSLYFYVINESFVIETSYICRYAKTATIFSFSGIKYAICLLWCFYTRWALITRLLL